MSFQSDCTRFLHFLQIPNAGIAEGGGVLTFDKHGKPLQPSLATMNVNLIGVLYSNSPAFLVIIIRDLTPLVQLFNLPYITFT